MSAPTKLDDDRVERICQALEKGMFVASAVRLGGVTESTWYLWKSKGKAGVQPYADYLERIAIAEMKANEFYVSRLHEAAKHDWRAALTVLQRRFRSEWGSDGPSPFSSGFDVSGIFGR